jgi:hypothetical protein
VTDRGVVMSGVGLVSFTHVDNALNESHLSKLSFKGGTEDSDSDKIETVL